MNAAHRQALACTFAPVAARASGWTHARLNGDLVRHLSYGAKPCLLALTATRGDKPDEARSAIERLHALWHTFRRLHVDARPEHPRRAADIERPDTHLADAADSVDRTPLDEAHTALASGRALLREIRSYVSGG